MKIKCLTLAAASLVLGLASCDKPTTSTSGSSTSSSSTASTAPTASTVATAADPKAAFATALNALGGEIDTIQKKAKASADPLSMIKEMEPVLAKVSALPTTGLPEDLTAGFNRFMKSTNEMVTVFKSIPADLPKDPAQIPAYMQANPEAMKAMQEVGTKMAAAQTEAEAAKVEFKAAATKNGIDISKFLEAGEESEASAGSDIKAEEPAVPDPAAPADSEPETK